MPVTFNEDNSTSSSASNAPSPQISNAGNFFPQLHASGVRRARWHGRTRLEEPSIDHRSPADASLCRPPGRRNACRAGLQPGLPPRLRDGVRGSASDHARGAQGADRLGGGRGGARSRCWAPAASAALGRPVEAGRLVRLDGLAGVTLYEPAELVMAARAGTPLAADRGAPGGQSAAARLRAARLRRPARRDRRARARSAARSPPISRARGGSRRARRATICSGCRRSPAGAS